MEQASEQQALATRQASRHRRRRRSAPPHQVSKHRTHPHHPSSFDQAISSCRRYADAFDAALQRDPALRSAATAPLTSGLGAAFAVDLSVLSAQPAEAIFFQAYGYEPWLLAPEKGVRALIRSALELFRPAVVATVDGVFDALKVAAVQAAERALAGAPDWQHQQLMEAALASVGAWRCAALHQVASLLDAESAAPDGAAFAAVRERLAAGGVQGEINMRENGSLGAAAAPAPAPAPRKKAAQEAEAPQAINILFGECWALAAGLHLPAVGWAHLPGTLQLCLSAYLPADPAVCSGPPQKAGSIWALGKAVVCARQARRHAGVLQGRWEGGWG